MKSQRLILPYFITFGIPLLILAVTAIVSLNLNALSADNKPVFTALTLDMVLTAPIVYFFLIRKKKISKFTVVPFFIAGLVIATFMIPVDQQQTLSLFKVYVLPIVELTVFTLIILKVKKALKAYKEAKTDNVDFIKALDETTKTLFPPKIAVAARTEIGLIYYGFFKWKKPKYASNEFSYHKDNGTLILLGTLLFASLVELFVVHLLLHNSAPVITWILSILSAYSILQIFGLMKSVPRTPIRITDKEVTFRMGLFLETTIPLEKIDSLELTIADYDKEDKSFQSIVPFSHNAILHLNDDEVKHGLFGMTKTYRHLVVSIDEKEAFLKLLKEKQANL